MSPISFSRGLKIYTLGLLTLIYTFNHIDRQIIAFLMQDIKTDTGFSDTQLGAITGLTFGILSAILAILIAYLADRVSRKKIIIVSLSLFSIMTFISGMAQNYIQFFLARLGADIGKTGADTPSNAIIADMYAPSERATPLAIFTLGVGIGSFAVFMVTGWFSDSFGWRTAIQVIALSSLLLTVLVWFTFKEPPRGMSDNIVAGKAPPMRETFLYMWQTKSIRQLIIGSTLIMTTGYGVSAWLPSYLIRMRDIGTGEIAVILSLIGIGTGVGAVFGGAVADKLGKYDVRWNVRLIALVTLASTPFSLMGYLASDATTAILWLILPMLSGGLYTAITLAMLLTLVKPEMRSLASAIFLLITNTFALGLSPLAVGMLSDQLTPHYGKQGLGIALAIMLLLGVWGGVHFWLAGRTLRQDIDNMKDPMIEKEL